MEPPAVRIVEVGPRDGLQNIKAQINTATKLELINRLHAAGLSTIEVTSIVSPRLVPQLADCRQVLAHSSVKDLLQNRQLRLPVLVPNLKGLQIAVEEGVREVAVFISASEGFSKANINATVEQGLERARLVAEKARHAGLDVRGYVSCIFADPFDGPTPQSAVLNAVQRLLGMGCYEVSLGDTLGVGTPSDVKSLISYLKHSGISLSRLAGHFHDTYGQAVANVWTAYQLGIRVFDSAVGGLGGCPFAPGAKGNVATEDLMYLFNQAGISTGVDLGKLVEVGEWISNQLLKPNESRAGAALVAKSRRTMSSNVSAKADVPKLAWSLATESEGLKTYRSGVNLQIVLNRPQNGNALTTSMIAELTEIFTQARSDPSITRIVISSQGKFFCTGMDLGKGVSPVAQSKEVSDAQYHRLIGLFEAIDTAPQVTIACINGPAFGGGVGLAFACDIRIAVRTAAFKLSEVTLGLCPATISKYVIREWGFSFTREAMLSSRPIVAAELKSLGSIALTVDNPVQLQQTLDEYLVRLKSAAPTASTMCKDLIKLAWTNAGSKEQEDGIKNIFNSMMASNGEAALGLKAFQSKKKAIDWDKLPRSATAKL